MLFARIQNKRPFSGPQYDSSNIYNRDSFFNGIVVKRKRMIYLPKSTSMHACVRTYNSMNMMNSY